MATTAQNNMLKQGAKAVQEHPVLTDGNGDINQGDMVYFDGTDDVVKSTGSNANNATFVGVAADSSYVNLYGTKKYVVALPVWVDGIFKFKTVNGQTYNHGDAVYFSTDAQTVTATDPGSGNVVGYVFLQNGEAAISGTGSNEVAIAIKPLWPVDGGI